MILLCNSYNICYILFAVGGIQAADEIRGEAEKSVRSTLEFHCGSDGEIFHMADGRS